MRDTKTENYDRILIAAIAVLVPTIPILTDLVAIPGSPEQRGSLSGYYYTSLRDPFVGISCALAALLIAHRLGERSVDNRLTTLAGIGALTLALFPTIPPAHTQYKALPALVQRRLGENFVGDLHVAGASLMLVSMVALTLVQAARQGRLPRTGRCSPQFWQGYHLACAVLMLAAGGYTLVHAWIGVSGRDASMVYSESLAVVAFAFSWFALGLPAHTVRVPSPASVDNRDAVRRPLAERHGVM